MIETDQLFYKLPDEVKEIIIRVQEPAEAWGLLKESYEDTQITVSSAIHTLQTLKLLVKVEALMLAVMTAKDCLRVSQSLITKQDSLIGRRGSVSKTDFGSGTGHRTPAPLYTYPRKDLPGGISS